MRNDQQPLSQPQSAPSARVLPELRVAITGGTAGLGLALVRELHAHGSHVAFVARTASRVAAIERDFVGTHGIVGDVASKDAIHRIALQVTGRLGGLDVLVNNASELGATPLQLLADTDCETFEQVIATNVLGPFRLTKALLGALAASAREGRGAVVLNVTSDAAVNAYARWGAYGTSKAALTHMTRIWNEELRENGVKLLALDPGDMDTSMHARALPDADPSQLKRPEVAARELVAALVDLLAQRSQLRRRAS